MFSSTTDQNRYENSNKFNGSLMSIFNPKCISASNGLYKWSVTPTPNTWSTTTTIAYRWSSTTSPYTLSSTTTFSDKWSSTTIVYTSSSTTTAQFNIDDEKPQPDLTTVKSKTDSDDDINKDVTKSTGFI